jgi:hypothetical protein
VEIQWRGPFTSCEANQLHAEAFGSRVFSDTDWNWRDRVAAHSLGWVTARDVDFSDDLASFYLDACGFQPTRAGLMALREPAPPTSGAPTRGLLD